MNDNWTPVISYPNLKDIIYKSFTKSEKEPQAQDIITFAPSYLYSCKRQIFYKKTGHKQSNPPDLPALLKMHWGDLLHADIQQRLQTSGVLESSEIHKTTEYAGLTFNYYYDGIINIDGNKYILEIKTIYGSGYRRVTDMPKDNHIIQCLSYMIFEDIQHGILLYAGRDNGYLKQHYLQFDGNILFVNNRRTDFYDRWLSLIADMADLKQKIESRQLPERDYDLYFKHDGNGNMTFEFQYLGINYKSDWQCSYCVFRNLCWQKELEEVKNHNFKYFINGNFF